MFKMFFISKLQICELNDLAVLGNAPMDTHHHTMPSAPYTIITLAFTACNSAATAPRNEHVNQLHFSRNSAGVSGWAFQLPF